MRPAAASAVFALVYALSVVAGCSSPPAVAPQPAADPPAPATSESTDVVQIEMRNVRLHVDEGIALEVRRLRGEMIPPAKRHPVFDDHRSYVLAIAEADMSIGMAGLERLMNSYVFAGEDAPLSDVRVRTSDKGRLAISGRLRKGVPVPFSTRVDVGVAEDGRLRLHADSFKALGVPAKAVLGAFGVELDDLVHPEDPSVVAVADNDLLVAPGRALPPPRIRGRLSRAALDGDRLVLVYAPIGRRPVRLAPPDPRAGNYIYFARGHITFGKLTMAEADLQLIDLDPRDPFDFFPARYSRQLVAGYSKNTPRQGLKTYLPDYDDLR
jgi:hypothetical protein